MEYIHGMLYSFFCFFIDKFDRKMSDWVSLVNIKILVKVKVSFCKIDVDVPFDHWWEEVFQNESREWDLVNGSILIVIVVYVFHCCSSVEFLRNKKIWAHNTLAIFYSLACLWLYIMVPHNLFCVWYHRTITPYCKTLQIIIWAKRKFPRFFVCVTILYLCQFLSLVIVVIAPPHFLSYVFSKQNNDLSTHGIYSFSILT